MNQFMLERERRRRPDAWGEFAMISPALTEEEKDEIGEELREKMLRLTAKRGVLVSADSFREIRHEMTIEPWGMPTIAVRCEAYRGKSQMKCVRKAARARWMWIRREKDGAERRDNS